jgi:TetR/AcrR family transcriptional regulator, fatty acid metabolism regulator protein
MKATKKSIETLIMGAAMDVFSSGDFETATMRSIARRANVPTSNIYKYFQNKDSLYVALISTIIDRSNRELDMHLVGLSNTKTKIRTMIEFHLNFFQENLRVARLIFAGTSISYWYEHEKAYKAVRESGSVLMRVIEEGKRSGEIRPDLDLHVMNHIYFGALRAMVVNWLYRHHEYRLSDMSGSFADAIYEGISSEARENHQFICPLTAKKK